MFSRILFLLSRFGAYIVNDRREDTRKRANKCTGVHIVQDNQHQFTWFWRAESCIIMSKSVAFGSKTFRETFTFAQKTTAHWFPGHMYSGKQHLIFPGSSEQNYHFTVTNEYTVIQYNENILNWSIQIPLFFYQYPVPIYLL